MAIRGGGGGARGGGGGVVATMVGDMRQSSSKCEKSVYFRERRFFRHGEVMIIVVVVVVVVRYWPACKWRGGLSLWSTGSMAHWPTSRFNKKMHDSKHVREGVCSVCFLDFIW